MPKDIVYILREDIQPEELRYSLRSIEKNFPHGKVWFVGGQPKGFRPDIALPHQQSGANKWEKIRSSMLKVVTMPELSEQFFLFNDDFFVMKPFKGKYINMTEKTLTWRIEDLRQVYPWLNHYGRSLVKAREELKTLGRSEINFETHTPFLMQKSIVAKSILQCSSPQMRSIYGNVNAIAYKDIKDVKVYDMEEVPEDSAFLSTNDSIFESGKVGAYIRAAFPDPCKYEEGGAIE